jgi:ATP/maltotriose-dependent transcriptional regulator MalT
MKLEEELPPNLIAAVERGKARDLEATLQELTVDLRRDSEQIVEAVPAMPSRHDVLSERELEILRLIALGHSNREIAEQLFLAVGTVKWYIGEIYSKLQVASRTQAVARARETNLIT